ncbi:MAG: LysM peptidoglycan-binding domain-containing protein [Gemmatimonadetes bacterium]|nr:LysM peptidoglycan-binding domain-containing protein [Gemmatimonadota bacterium]
MMLRATAAFLAFLFITALGPPPAWAQSLRGSKASLERQNRAAGRHDFTYLLSTRQVKKFVRLGLLVPLAGNAYYELARVSFPYARPEARLFVERLSRQYYAACGEKLVVTSLVRPIARQPRNASDQSVHPTGMALDLRQSGNRWCRRWLEDTLLHLEDRGVLEATRERHPPHYHVAVFPSRYEHYVQARRGTAASRRLAQGASPQAGSLANGRDTATHQVRRGETLWSIARRHGLTVEQIKEYNGLATSRILAGQVLTLPAGSSR